MSFGNLSFTPKAQRVTRFSRSMIRLWSSRVIISLWENFSLLKTAACCTLSSVALYNFNMFLQEITDFKCAARNTKFLIVFALALNISSTDDPNFQAGDKDGELVIEPHAYNSI